MRFRKKKICMDRCSEIVWTIKEFRITRPVVCLLMVTDKFRLESNTAGGALFQFQQGQWALNGYHWKRLQQATDNYIVRAVYFGL